MAFAMLGLIGEVTLDDEAVVSKSYPEFWDDFRRIVR
jgi:5-enolpyruvylshikimate-3-phosphate synthase